MVKKPMCLNVITQMNKEKGMKYLSTVIPVKRHKYILLALTRLYR